MRLVSLKRTTIYEIIGIISVHSITFLFPLSKLAPKTVIFGNEVAFAIKSILMEMPNIILTIVPLIYSVPFLHAVDKLTLIE